MPLELVGITHRTAEDRPYNTRIVIDINDLGPGGLLDSEVDTILNKASSEFSVYINLMLGTLDKYQLRWYHPDRHTLHGTLVTSAYRWCVNSMGRGYWSSWCIHSVATVFTMEYNFTGESLKDDDE
jgi:hypothetical protein